MKTKEEILKPFIERPFRHTEVVDKDNALIAMQQYADQFRETSWIKIDSENFPKDYENVMYVTSDGFQGIGHFVWSQSKPRNVTHFAPLLANPK